MLALRLLAVALVVLTYSGTALAQLSTPTVFGSTRFVRTHGRPDTFERTFVVPAWVVGPFTLRVENGAPDGSNRQVLGWIWINGKRVVAPSDFRRNRNKRLDEEHERGSFADREDDDDDEQMERKRGRPVSDGVIVREVTLKATNTLRVRLSGRRARYVTVTITGTNGDRTGPQLTLLEPAVTTISSAPVQVRWRYSDGVGAGERGASGVVPSTLRVTIDGLDKTSSFAATATEASASLVLGEGSHALEATVSDLAGNASTALSTFTVDRTAPNLTLTSPEEGAVVANVPFLARGTVVDSATVSVTVDGVPASVAGNEWSAMIGAGPDGDRTIAVAAVDVAGNQSAVSRRFVVDTTPPVLTILEPVAGMSTLASEVTVTGTVEDLTLQSVLVNGVTAGSSTFHATVPLNEGDNVISVAATDATGRTAAAQVHVTRIIENPCEYSISPSTAAVSADAGSGLVAVSTTDGCDWTASTSAEWLAIGSVAGGYGDQVTADGAVGFWRLDDIDGSALRDSSGHHFDGALFGGYTQDVPGALAAANGATLFEGGVVQFANGPTLLGGPFTVEVWLQNPSWGSVAGGSGWMLSIESGHVRFRGERNEVERFNVRSERSLDDGEWHHVVATYDPPHQTVSMFVDGVLDASGPTLLSAMNGSTFFTMGPMAATVDELAVYRPALSASQVAAHFDLRGATSGGPGSVTYTVEPNPGFQPRAGTMTVAGHAVSITQAGRNCFTVAPTTINPGPGGGAGTIHITAIDNTCDWTVTPGASWITIDSSSGTASGDVHYSVAANPALLDRIATLTVAGQVVSVGQGGVPVQRTAFHFSLAAGLQHSLALNNDGRVWSWGANSLNQLGDATPVSRALPGLVPAPTNVVAIAAGDTHSLALRSDGTVWAWGSNAWGQLGDGTGSFHPAPVQVTALANLVEIAAGSDHNVALEADGTVWTWGRNLFGQLGDGTTSNRTTPARVTGITSRAISVSAIGARTYVVDAAGRLWQFGFDAPTLSQIPLASPVVSVTASLTGWSAITPEGVTIASDASTPPPMVESASQMSVGQSHTLALHADGRIWTWGSNDVGQLGDGTRVARPSPVQIADAGLVWHTGTPILTSGGVFNVEMGAIAASGTPGAVIHYTLNGADPTESDPIMPAAPSGIVIRETTTVKARAWAAGKPPSGMAVETFTLKPVTPVVSPGSGTYTATQSVSVTTVTAETTLRYTLDGTGPTAASPAYVSPIAIGTATILKVAAFRSGWTPSDVVTAAYTFPVPPPPPPDIDVPPPVPCTYHVAPGAVAAPAQATTGELTVTTNDESCGWSVATDVPWLSVDTAGHESPYAQAVSADEPVGYWRLADPVGAVVAADSSGFGRSASVSGGVTFGRAGPLADGSTAASFDGHTGAIEIQHDAGLSLTALTWEAWVNVPSVSSEWRWILGEGDTSEVFSLWIAPGAQRATLYYDLAGAGRQQVLLQTTLVGAGWVHLAFAFGSTAWHAYVNGVEDQTGPGGGALAASSGPILLGRDYAGGSWYDSLLAEAALYPVALSAAQIANHAAQRGVMVRGGGRFSYVVAANLTATSRAASMTVAGAAVPVMQAPPGGIAIAGGASRLSPSGWTNTGVTVSFVCAGDGAIACPAPVTLLRDGEYDVPGQAVNDLGGTASTTVHVGIDKSAPYVSVSSPALHQLVNAGELAIRGTTIDLVSGLTSLTCNDAPATITDSAFLCNVTVPAGTSTVTLRAVDAASNVRATTVSVITEDAVSSSPPTSLRLSPRNPTMLAGETKRFSLLDNFDRIPSQAEWTIDNATVAVLSTAPDVRLTAVSAGTVTLTARWQGLSATTRVTVSGATAPAIGTTLWSAPAARGPVTQIVQGAVTLDNERRMYALEHNGLIPQDLIRAFDVDGREVWAMSVGGHVSQLSGDPFGGVVALHGGTITGFTANGNGFSVGLDAGPGFAIDADGVTYYVSRGVLMVGSGVMPLPEPETPGGSIDTGIPTVLEDGRIALPIHLTNTGLTPDRLQLFVLTPNGGSSVRTLWESGAAVLLQDGITWLRPPADAVTPYKAVPNGRGDIFVAWSAVHTALGSANNPASAYVGILRSDGQTGEFLAEVGGIWGIPDQYPLGDLVVAEDRVIATAYRLYDQQNEAVATQLTLTGLTISQDAWSAPEGQVPQFPTFLAAPGGGVIVSHPDGTMSGPDPVFGQMHLAKAQYFRGGTWFGRENQQLAAKAGPFVAEPYSVWAGLHGGNQGANAASKPGRGIFAKSHDLGIGFNHMSLRMAPTNITSWFGDQPELFFRSDSENQAIPNLDSYGNRFFTIGAGPAHGDTSYLCSGPFVGALISERNRPADATQPADYLERLDYSPLLEDEVIRRLKVLDERYRDDLPYACLPVLSTEGYNSNSYIAGLLKTADIPEPAFIKTRKGEHPGWTKPVPVLSFRLSQ